MDKSTGKTYATREDAIADGVDPKRIVQFEPGAMFTSSRRMRRTKTLREVRIENQAAAQASPAERNRRAARRRVQKQSRKKNRGK